MYGWTVTSERPRLAVIAERAEKENHLASLYTRSLRHLPNGLQKNLKKMKKSWIFLSGIPAKPLCKVGKNTGMAGEAMLRGWLEQEEQLAGDAGLRLRRAAQIN